MMCAGTFALQLAKSRALLKSSECSIIFIRLLSIPQTPMGNTHTKLLAGAFSVLSIAQFFMVSNLASEVNQYTENATASIVAAAPMRMHLMRMQDERIKSRFVNAQRLQSAAGAEQTEVVRPLRGTNIKYVKPLGGNKPVIEYRTMSVPATTDAQ